MRRSQSPTLSLYPDARGKKHPLVSVPHVVAGRVSRVESDLEEGISPGSVLRVVWRMRLLPCTTGTAMGTVMGTVDPCQPFAKNSC